MYFKFGVDSFIWAENFSEKDLWIIPKAKEMGFEVIDFAISNPFTFPMEAVKEKLQETGIDCVCTTTLTDQTNPISPDPEIRKASVAAMKRAIDICNYLESPILGGVNYAAWGYLTKKPRTEQEWAWAVDWCLSGNFLPLCMKSAIPVPWSSNLSIPALKSWRATAPSGAISLPPERIWPGMAWQI